MPFLPLKEKPYTNVDSIGNSVAIEGFYDCDKDDFFNNKRRKGKKLFCDLGTGYQVDGIFNPTDSNIAVAFSDGKLFKIQENKTVTEITGVTLNRGIPVKHADFTGQSFYSNNSRILKWVIGGATCAFIADAQAPTNATHLGFIDQYLLALIANSQRIEWSDVGTPDVWRGEYESAESRPDKLVALMTAFGEILLPGTKTIEHHIDSGDSAAPFRRLDGTITERGSLSPYSLCQLDNSFMFLDEERRVIRLRGREPQVISNPYDAEFQKILNVTDAIGIHFNAGGDTKYIITFPTDNKTFAYDYKLDFWSEWSLWDQENGLRNRWIGNCGVLIPTWKKYLVGSKDDGKIYEASSEFTDDAGSVINTELITGRIDWGTSKRKSCKRLKVKIKRGTGGLNTSGILTINYRDNGKTKWSADKTIDLGVSGDNDIYKTFYTLKQYRDRQWRFRISSGEPLLVSAEEDFVVIN